MNEKCFLPSPETESVIIKRRKYLSIDRSLDNDKLINRFLYHSNRSNDALLIQAS